MLLVILSSIIYSLMASENVVVMMHKTPTTRGENASKSNFKEARGNLREGANCEQIMPMQEESAH